MNTEAMIREAVEECDAIDEILERIKNLGRDGERNGDGNKTIEGDTK